MDWRQIQGQGSFWVIFACLCLFVSASYVPSSSIRWGRSTSFQVAQMHGALLDCSWTECASEEISAQFQGCRVSGQVLRGDPKKCDNGGVKYRCCAVPIGATVPLTPSGNDGVAVTPAGSQLPLHLPPLMVAFANWMDRKTKKVNRFKIWLDKKQQEWKTHRFQSKPKRHYYNYHYRT